MLSSTDEKTVTPGRLGDCLGQGRPWEVGHHALRVGLSPPPQLRLWGSGQLNSWGGHGQDSFQWLSGWLSLSTGGATRGEVGYEADKTTTYGTVTREGVTQASLSPSSSSP